MPEGAGKKESFAGLRQGAKTILRDAYRVQHLPSSQNSSARSLRLPDSSRCCMVVYRPFVDVDEYALVSCRRSDKLQVYARLQLRVLTSVPQE